MKFIFQTFILLISVWFSTVVNAATAAGYAPPEETGIVTPEIAVGVRSYEYYTHDTNGNMVVCESDNYSRNNKCDGGWKLLKDVVPGGRKFVGFKIVSRGYGYPRIEIYWK